jgi:hypothetical protein
MLDIIQQIFVRIRVFLSYDSQYKKLFCPKTTVETEDLRQYYPFWELETE